MSFDEDDHDLAMMMAKTTVRLRRRYLDDVHLGCPFKHVFFVVLSMQNTVLNILFWGRKAHLDMECPFLFSLSDLFVAPGLSRSRVGDDDHDDDSVECR